MRDTLIGPGPCGFSDGVLVALNPELADALMAVVDENITVDDVQEGDGDE